MEYEPLSKIEQEIDKEFERMYENRLEEEDFHDMEGLKQEMKQISPDIADVNIIVTSQEAWIEFILNSPDMMSPDRYHLFLERDEDDDCWML
jgi:hypothetical protein